MIPQARFMGLINRCRSGWERLAAAEALPKEVEAALVRPLYTRLSSLLGAHLTFLVVATAMMLRVGGAWAAVFLAAQLLVMVARGSVVLSVRRQGSTTAGDVLRWRRPYQAVALVWVMASSAMCS